MEFIAPILTNLSNEVAKIYDLLPKILDIKSEVVNTADTVRDMRVFMKNVESRMLNVSHASRSVPSSPSPAHLQPPITPIQKNSTTPESVISKSKSNKIIELQQSILSNNKDNNKDACNSSSSSVGMNTHKNCTALNDQSTHGETPPDDDNRNPWIPANNKRRNGKKLSTVTGCKKSYVANFKGIGKSIDIFIGQAATNCSTNGIFDYIDNDIDVKAISVEQLSITTKDYNCFKVRINIKDRDKLFNPEMWPLGIVIKNILQIKGLISIIKVHTLKIFSTPI